MPRKVITTETTETMPETEVIDTEEELEIAAETALDGLLAEFSGADADVVNVYRQGEGKNISFLFKTMPEEMSGGDIMERCRDQFGTGDYRLHVRKGARILANRSFSVEAPTKPETPQQPQQFGITELMAMMTKQNENMQSMFANTLTAIATMTAGAAKNQPAVDPIAMQTSMLQGLVTMKDLAGDDKGPGPVEMLIKGLELAKDMSPKTGETNTNDIFLKALEAFPALAQAGKAATQGGMPSARPSPPMAPAPGQGHVNPPMKTSAGTVHALKAPPPPAQNPAPVNPAPENEATKEQTEFFAQARDHLQGLCRLAAQDKDPEIYAPMIVDQMGEEAVREFIGHDNALDQLASIEPTVTLYPGWFNHLKEAILDILQPDTEPVPEEAPIIKDGPEGAPVSDEPEELSPELVLERINASGLRREGQQNAPILIPAPDGQADVVWFGGDSEPASDT